MKLPKEYFVGAFLRWWIFFVLLLLVGTAAQYFGGFELLYQKDVTYISFAILGIFFITTLWIGKWTYRSEMDIINTDTAKFVANQLVKLGLIGTVIGFIMMLAKMSGDFSFATSEEAAPLLGGMAAGMTAALYTTLMGLVCSGLLQVQLRYLDIVLLRRDRAMKSKRIPVKKGKAK